MAKQIIKGTTMLLLLVTLAFVTSVVSAQAQSRMSVADIPFEFVAASKSMPAGQYRIANNTAGGEVVKITAAKRDASVFTLTTRLQKGARVEQGALVFHRYGNRYFLAEIWTAGESQGQKLLKSREEKAIERELASIPSKSELAQSRYERIEVALVRQK